MSKYAVGSVSTRNFATKTDDLQDVKISEYTRKPNINLAGKTTSQLLMSSKNQLKSTVKD